MGARLRPATSAAIAATSLTTAWVACRMFADDSSVGRLAAAVLVIHATSFLLRTTRVRPWLATAALLPVGLVLLTFLHYRATAWGPLPTGSTLGELVSDLRIVGEQFATAVAPVPAEGSFAAAITLVVIAVAIIGDTFATRMGGALHAIVPGGALVVLTGAVGTERAAVGGTAVWLAVAAATVAVARAEATSTHTYWLDDERPNATSFAAAVLGLAVLAASAAAFVGPKLPGAGEPALIDARHRNGDTTSVLDPLVDIRARMTNTGLVEMFTVQSSDGGHYWRSMGLPEFDGATFSPAAGDLEPLGDRTASAPAGSIFTSQVVRIAALRGNIVPATATPVMVSPTVVWWAPDTGSLVVPDSELRRGDSIAIASGVVDPSAQTLDSGTSGNAPAGTLDLPSLPDSVRATALEVTAQAATPYRKLLALQDWFRSEFVYDLSVQIGDSPDAMEVFLRDRRGFCQQFAVTFAAMARSLGIPAQVAVGFTQGDLGADGLFHVYGRHAHAWPEVWFDGIGWVAFEPTPGRGNPDASDWTNVGAAQDDSRGTGSGTGSGSTPGEPTPPTTPTVTTLPREEVPSTTPRPETGAPGTSGEVTAPGRARNEMPLAAKVVIAVVAGGAALLGGWVVLMPMVVGLAARARRRRPAERVAALWQRARRDLADAGAPPSPSLTPVQFAREAELSTSVDHRSLRDMAQLVTVAVYAPAEVSPTDADRMARLADDVREMARPGIPVRTRWRNRLDPRSVAARSAH
ncbi:MAG: DUF4129 domain-containing transglutaminase family protein [Ilumatobacteraceae bacterium]